MYIQLEFSKEGEVYKSLSDVLIAKYFPTFDENYKPTDPGARNMKDITSRHSKNSQRIKL